MSAEHTSVRGANTASYVHQNEFALPGLGLAVNVDTHQVQGTHTVAVSQSMNGRTVPAARGVISRLPGSGDILVTLDTGMRAQPSQLAVDALFYLAATAAPAGDADPRIQLHLPPVLTDDNLKSLVEARGFHRDPTQSSWAQPLPAVSAASLELAVGAPFAGSPDFTLAHLPLGNVVLSAA